MVWQWLAFVEAKIQENSEAADRQQSREELAAAICKDWTDAMSAGDATPSSSEPVYKLAEGYVQEQTKQRAKDSANQPTSEGVTEASILADMTKKKVVITELKKRVGELKKAQR